MFRPTNTLRVYQLFPALRRRGHGNPSSLPGARRQPPQAAPFWPSPNPALPSLAPRLLPPARREKRTSKARTVPFAVLLTPPVSSPGSQTDNTVPPKTRGCSPPSLGPSEAPSPRGSWEAALSPPPPHHHHSARGSGFRVGSGSTRIRHKGAPVPAAERRRWLRREGGMEAGGWGGGCGSLRSPQRRSGGRPAAGRPAAGHLVKVRPAAGMQGTRRDAELSRELPPVPPHTHTANNLPGLGDPPPLPHALPGVSHPPQAEPRRAVSRSPSTHRQRPARAPPSPTRPLSVRKLFPRSCQRLPNRAARRGEAAGNGVGLCCRDLPPAPYGEHVRKASRQAAARAQSPQPRRR